jgi:hypothetical protein
LKAKRDSYDAKIAALRADFEAEKRELEKSIAEAESSEQTLTDDREAMGQLRKSEAAPNGRRAL